MVQIFKEYFIFCLDIIATAKIHGIAPKEDYSVCLFWIYTAFVGRYGDVVIILSQTYSAEIVFMMKEEKNKKKCMKQKNEDLNFWTLYLCRQYHLTRVFIYAVLSPIMYCLACACEELVLFCFQQSLTWLSYSYIWWTSRQYEGFGLQACVNWHLDEDTRHLEMSKETHAHSPQLSLEIGSVR